jgi:hypothetical protein
MTKNTKTLLLVGGVAIVGYLLYKKYGKGMGMTTTTKSTSTSSTSNFAGESEFFNASGKMYSRLSQCTGDGCMQMCSDGCEGGYCMVAQYDASGNIKGYVKARCGGTYGSGTIAAKR